MVFKKKRSKIDIKSSTTIPVDLDDMDEDARLRENDLLREEILADDQQQRQIGYGIA